jgi:hypothetical protein
VRVRWEHAGLGAQENLLGFSLCLWPLAHRGPQDAWQLGALPARRKDPELQDMRCSRALPTGLEPWYTW